MATKKNSFFDPLNIDRLATKYFRMVRQIEHTDLFSQDKIGKPSHPLLHDPQIATIMQYIENKKFELENRRGIGDKDIYFTSSKDYNLRPEVIIAFALDFLRPRPELLESKKTRRQKLHRAARSSFRDSHVALYHIHPNKWVAYLGANMLSISNSNHSRKDLMQRYKTEYRVILKATGYSIEDILFFKASDPQKKHRHHKKQ